MFHSGPKIFDTLTRGPVFLGDPCVNPTSGLFLVPLPRTQRGQIIRDKSLSDVSEPSERRCLGKSAADISYVTRYVFSVFWKRNSLRTRLVCGEKKKKPRYGSKKRLGAQ